MKKSNHNIKKDKRNHTKKYVKKFGMLVVVAAVVFGIITSASLTPINATVKAETNISDAKGVSADSVQTETIRVGFTDTDKFIRAINGKHTGYGVEYLDKIAKYTGWKYEYVHDTWENCFDMLEKGQIDLVCTTDTSSEKRRKFLYSDQHIGYSYSAFYVNSDSEICYEDYEGMDGCRFGVINKTTNIEGLRNIAKEKNFDFDTVLFDTEVEVLDALKEGDIDVAVTSSLMDAGNLKVVGKHKPEDIYCVMSKNKKEQMQQLNLAIEKIKTENPGFGEKLLERYNDVDSYADMISFTKEESEYIQSAEPVKIMLLEDARPISYVKEGELTGIFVKFLKKLSAISGLQFEFIIGTDDISMEEYCQGAMAGEYLLLGTKNAVKYTDLLQGAIASEDFIESKMSYVKRHDVALAEKKDSYTFAMTKDLSYFAELMKNRPNSHKIVFYDSLEECMDAVLEKKADITVQDAYLIAYALKGAKYEKALVECPGEVVLNNMCLIGTEDDSMLFQILSKCNKYISSTEKEELIAMELLSNPYEQDFEDVLRRHYDVIVTIVCMLFIAAVAYGIIMRKMARLAFEKKEFELLEKKVQQDELTGIYNRNYFYEKARKMIDNNNAGMCIVTVDISDFKMINEVYGLEKGDMVLKHLAGELVRMTEGRNIIVSRFTADHYFMCMEAIDFGEISFPRKFENVLDDLEISVSYGVYLIENHKQDAVNLMCDRAELALKGKERKGIDFIHYFSEEDRLAMLNAHEIERDMEKAIENKEFQIYVQPKYDLNEERIVGGEALVRWIHPEKGVIPPFKFIDIFEKNGFIQLMDYYVWEETCKFLNELKYQGYDSLPISINISKAHMFGRELQYKLEDLVQRYKIKPELLELEITESVCAGDTDIIYEKIKGLRKAGFKVAMDDFGSGYSSLNMLKDMPLDIIKMDMKFLDEGDNVEKSRNILETLISLAKSIDLEVIVEGVETEEQANFLKSIQCYNIQGYYFSKPVDCDTYKNMLNKDNRA